MTSLFDDATSQNKWSALEDCAHPLDPTVDQSLDQVSVTSQSEEVVVMIKDSCDIEVNTTSTEAAVSIQLALQVAVAIILEVSIADSINQNEILQDLLQLTATKQSTKQKTIIENSRGVKVTSTETEIAITAQIAIQILIALLVAIEIL